MIPKFKINSSRAKNFLKITAYISYVGKKNNLSFHIKSYEFKSHHLCENEHFALQMDGVLFCHKYYIVV